MKKPFETEDDLYWPEGEKDTDTLADAGLLAFTFGGVGDGLPAGCEEFVRDRDVVILADNDDPGREHAEKKAALAFTVAKSVRVVHFPELPEKGDVSDWLPHHSVEELKERVSATDPWVPEVDASEATCAPGDSDKGLTLPNGYRFREDGLYWEDDLRLSGRFDILAETRGSDGNNWGLLLHWTDHDNRDHHFALQKVMLAGDGADARRVLLDGGLYIAPSQKARSHFNSFLLQVRSSNRARATSRIGWHDQAFVLPDESFGDSAGRQNAAADCDRSRAHLSTIGNARELAAGGR